ncbi:hypothetical protein CEXT_35011, partial [Caerostris extrusa]
DFRSAAGEKIDENFRSLKSWAGHGRFLLVL